MSRDDRDDGSPRAGTSRPLYAPADTQGRFSPHINDDTRFAESFDLDELELDPSERRPDGPVAKAFLELPPAVLLRKWAWPLIAFLGASFLQSIGLFSATRLYIWWMGRIAEDLGPAHNAFLQNATDQKEHTRADDFRLPDPFHDWVPGPNPILVFSYLTPLIPVLWCVAVVQRKNLRLWTRTLIVGTILALLKAFISWMTVVPHAAGWAACRKQLNLSIDADTAVSFLGIIESFFQVIWLGLANVFTGNRGSQGLLCSDGVVSGTTYFSALFALALYDAVRVETRKMKQHFRWLYRGIFGFVLTVLVLQAAHVDLLARRQYGADVVLALVLTLLLYGNPAVAICADRWLKYGSGNIALSADASGQLTDPYDEGDVVVPVCCIPFCCLHGRYFLYTSSVEEVKAELQSHESREKRFAAEARKKAAGVAEQFRVSQEENARQLLELEALIQSERQRAEVRERDEREEAKLKHEKALAELRASFELRIAKGLADLEKELKDELQAAAQYEENGDEALKAFEAKTDEVCRLEVKTVEVSRAVAEKQALLASLKDEAEQEKKKLSQLAGEAKAKDEPLSNAVPVETPEATESEVATTTAEKLELDTTEMKKEVASKVDDPVKEAKLDNVEEVAPVVSLGVEQKEKPESNEVRSLVEEASKELAPLEAEAQELAAPLEAEAKEDVEEKLEAGSTAENPFE